jgi:predicted transposase/invertase (TIGR01784 family)
MRTDTIFYKLFQTFNTLLFELLNQPFEEGYQFISVEVKEKAFRFDGIFAPDSIDKPIYFVEVQFQKKPNFYWEFLSEILLYLSQYLPQNDWKAVAIFSDRAIAPTQLSIFQQELIANNRLISIYLNELPDSDSVAIAIVQLVKCREQDAPKIVEELKQQNLNPDIIELVEAVLVSKFKNLSREEIEAMFALSDLKNTRVYKEAVQEGVRRGLHRGWQKGKEEGKQEGKKEGKKEGKQEIALNLLRIGMDVVQVSQVTGLTIAQVSRLQEG